MYCVELDHVNALFVLAADSAEIILQPSKSRVVGQVYQKASITVRSGDTVLLRKKRPIMAPGEMETVYIKKDSLSPDNIGNDITISVEEE